MSNQGLGFSEPSVKKLINLSDMYPVIEEVLSAGGNISLTITGSSMYPTILGGRDQVTLVKAPEKLNKYDLPLYRRKSGQFVLHRIVAVEEDGTYTCCGDHQWDVEKGLKQEQMIGLATEFVRKGKHFSADNRRYVRWVHFWVWFLRGRKFWFAIDSRVRKILSFMRGVFRHFFKKKTTAKK